MFGISRSCVVFLYWKVTCTSSTLTDCCVFFLSCMPAGSMNSLPARVALSLCRRTTAAGGMRVLAGSTTHPGVVLPADRNSFQAVRVCHSGTSRKGSVSTKKRGYDITRNPHLNKVSSVRVLKTNQNIACRRLKVLLSIMLNVCNLNGVRMMCRIIAFNTQSYNISLDTDFNIT